jgi:hypothetical protein
MFIEKINKQISFYFVLFTLGLFSIVNIANAATINFRPDTASYSVGDNMSIRVYVATDAQSVNAISANVKYPSDLLTLSSISKSGSVINLWAQDPVYSNSEGTASFEGVILNGYAGSSGTAVTLSFKAKKAGTATVKFTNASILANDGNGTDIITGKGVATFIIGSKAPVVAAPVQKPVVKEVAPVIVVKDTTLVISEIKNQDPKDASNRFLITSPQKVKDNSYTIQIDSQLPFTWIDDGAHTYTAPTLSRGDHTIKAQAADATGSVLSGFQNFYSRILSVPTLSIVRDIFTDQTPIFSGKADANVDVMVTIGNVTTGELSTYPTKTNADGIFTYIASSPLPKGSYTVRAFATTSDGIMSDSSEALPFAVKEHWFNAFIALLNKYLTMLTPLLALLALSIGSSMYFYYKLRHLQIYLAKKLFKANTLIDKSFELLEEDVDEEMSIFRKIKANKPLDKEEQAFLNKFKKDIEAAQKVISKEVKDIDK